MPDQYSEDLMTSQFFVHGASQMELPINRLALSLSTRLVLEGTVIGTLCHIWSLMKSVSELPLLMDGSRRSGTRIVTMRLNSWVLLELLNSEHSDLTHSTRSPGNVAFSAKN